MMWHITVALTEKDEILLTGSGLCRYISLTTLKTDFRPAMHKCYIELIPTFAERNTGSKLSVMFVSIIRPSFIHAPQM